MPAAEGVFAFHRHCPEKSRIRASSGTGRIQISGRMHSEGYFEGHPDCAESRGDPGGQKAEVIQVVLETFDQEKYEKAMKQEGYEDGYHDGKVDGYNDGRTDGYDAGRTDGYSAGCEEGLRQLISTLMDIREKYGLSDNEIVSEIMQKYSLTEDEAVKKIEEFRTE